ncbi:MAG: hypothetical protein WBG50_01350 [Desulfomonilaceae bacterium]
MIAAALLDDQVMPEQYRSERIQSDDIQALLRKISVTPSDDYSRRFPDEVPCRITVSLRNGTKISREVTDYEGFHTRPMSWKSEIAKVQALAAKHCNTSLLGEIVEAVAELDAIDVSDLTRLLEKIREK